MQTLIDDHVASRESPGVCGLMESLVSASVELLNSLTDGSLFLPCSLIKDQYLLSLRSRALIPKATKKRGIFLLLNAAVCLVVSLLLFTHFLSVIVLR